MTAELHACMGLSARYTIIAHNLFLLISIGCVSKVHPLLVCESGGRGCPRDSVIQVVLCIIIVPGLMNKEPPQFTTSLRAWLSMLPEGLTNPTGVSFKKLYTVPWAVILKTPVRTNPTKYETKEDGSS